MNKINWETATQEEIREWCRNNREKDEADFMSRVVKVMDEAYRDKEDK